MLRGGSSEKRKGEGEHEQTNWKHSAVCHWIGNRDLGGLRHSHRRTRGSRQRGYALGRHHHASERVEFGATSERR